MARDDDVARIGARALKETAKALLIDAGDEQVWVPKSVIHDDSEVYAAGHEGELVVQAWFGRKHGWD